jgi:hypothetical protein
MAWGKGLEKDRERERERERELELEGQKEIKKGGSEEGRFLRRTDIEGFDKFRSQEARERYSFSKLFIKLRKRAEI